MNYYIIFFFFLQENFNTDYEIGIPRHDFPKKPDFQRFLSASVAPFTTLAPFSTLAPFTTKKGLGKSPSPALFVRFTDYLFIAFSTATATATVAPTIGLLPIPISPIIST